MELKTQRDFGDLLQDCINFSIKNAKPLWRIVFTYVTPLFMLIGIINGFVQYEVSEYVKEYQANIQEAITNQDVEQIQRILATFIVKIYGNWRYVGMVILNLIFTTFMSGVIYFYLKSYANKTLSQYEDSDFIKFSLGKLPVLLLYNILSGVIVMIGCLFFIFPGIYLFLPLSIAFPVFIVEETSIRESIARSFALVKGYWWQSFLAIVVIYFLVIFVFAVPQGLLSMFLLGLQKTIGLKMVTVITSSISSIFASIYYTALYITITIIYFSLVAEKDSWQGKIEEMGKNS